MHRLVPAGLAALLFAAPVASLAQPAADVTYATAAQVQALAAQAKAGMKPGQTAAVQPVLKLAPYASNVEVRTGPGAAAIHETDAEFFVVVDGSGVMQTGGTVVEPKRTDAHNINGTSLQGATDHNLAKGDVLVVPQGTPHRISKVDGTLILMSLHVPRDGAGADKK